MSSIKEPEDFTLKFSVARKLFLIQQKIVTAV